MTELKALEALPDRLYKARMAKGMSLRDVADEVERHRIRLSHVAVSKYEKGDTVPTIKVLEVLAKVYEMPTSWFLESGTPIANVAFRNLKSRVTEGEKKKYAANAQRWLEAYAKLELRLGSHLVTKAKVDRDGTPQELAARVRKELGHQESAPIPSIVDVLEKFGVRTMELPTDLSIDGLSCKFGDEFAVLLNPATSHDRARMNAAHELGHVLLGHCDSEQALKDRDCEAEAFEFASHLLLPQSELEKVFRDRSLVELVTAKEKFGISMQAMIYRASRGEEQLLDDRTAKWLWIQFAKRRWRKNEPGNVRPDRATRFERMLESAISSKKLRWTEAAALLAIRREELEERIELTVSGELDEPDVLQFNA